MDFIVDKDIGLTENLVKDRIDNNLVNTRCDYDTKTIKSIIKNNTFTLFNIINIILAILVFTTGQYKNMLFIFVIIINTVISTIQEIRSKKIIDKLKILNESHIDVLRDGKVTNISVYEIVKNDIIIIKNGQQIPVDCAVINGFCEVDESLLTGESEYITKNQGDNLLSGSFLVSGKVKAEVTKIGSESYVNTITSNLKHIKSQKSEIVKFIDTFVKFIGIIIIPIALLMFFKQYSITNTYNASVVATVAALIGMIPEGLVLMSSIVMALSVIRLFKYKTLVQELYSIENLAMSDIIFLDKTGTITSGNMVVDYIKDFDNCCCELNKLINILDDKSSTSVSIENYLKENGMIDNNKNEDFIKIIPFSSFKKYSGVIYQNKTVIFGAPTIILKNNEYNSIKEYIDKYLSDGKRVLVVAESYEKPSENILENTFMPIGLIIISDEIRKGVESTIKYLYEQGMKIKIISGDNPLSVSKIAKKVGIKGSEYYIDVSKISDREMIDNANNYTIFGMVSPFQKLELVKAFKNNKEYVAMIGDGVNDTLALKEANCSIAMASGSDAAKNVSEIVLLDSDFSSVPIILDEGRRAINNIRRSSSLFTIKTIFSCVLAVLFLLVDLQYPFVPIQMTLISSLAVGIPSFFLAFEGDYNKVDKKFIRQILTYSLPGGISVVLNIILITVLNGFLQLPYDIVNFFYISSTAMATFWVLIAICKPYSLFKVILVIFSICCFIGAIIFMGDFFSIPKVGLKVFLTTPLFLITTFIFRKMVQHSLYLYWNRKTFIV